MIPYLIIFIITTFIAFKRFGKPKVSKPFFFAYCVFLGLFVGMGDMLGGYDRYIYGEVFQSIAMNTRYGDGSILEVFIRFFSTEPLYGMMNILVGSFTPNRYIFISLFTLIMYVLYADSIYRYTSNPFFSLLIFLGLMFFFSFTYLRQMMACGVCWFAIRYVIERRFWRFLLFVVIATLIHNSAAYFLILYFIPLQKYPRVVVLRVMIFLLLIGLSGVTQYVFKIAGDSLGNEKIAGYQESAVYGLRIDYLIEAVFFLVILLRNYSQIKTDKYNLTIFNIYLMFCGVLFLFCRNSDGGRISWYCMIGVMVLMSDLCHPKSAVNLRSFVAILSFGLFCRILTGWGSVGILYPYKTFLTNGHTGSEEVYQRYEYDENYDYDKLYNLTFRD